ncbi:MAG: hypothetical protein KGL39_00125 [Patescibacteria group bacterium]|nr:hypothetical protein [Patescibacteria group bacterium]
MSYNIDSCEYLKGSLRIKRGDVSKLIEKHQETGNIPEGNFLEDLNLTGSPDEELIIEVPNWYSECSGYTYDVFKEVLSHTTGEADILLVWEGGDSQTGLRVRNGKVKEMTVKATLKE